jgi:hypothetical protein
VTYSPLEVITATTQVDLGIQGLFPYQQNKNGESLTAFPGKAIMLLSNIVELIGPSRPEFVFGTESIFEHDKFSEIPG